MSPPDFHTTHASDNPDHEKVEAQRERDRSETRARQADVGEAAGQDDNRDVVEREAKQGAGPAGLNNGPSDTRSADPRRPMAEGNRTAGNMGSGRDPSSDGMGTSPKQGAQPMSDKPEFRRPGEERAGTLGEGRDPAGQRAGGQSREEGQQARREGQEARSDRGEAERKIGENQSPGPGAQGNEADKRSGGTSTGQNQDRA